MNEQQQPEPQPLTVEALTDLDEGGELTSEAATLAGRHAPEVVYSVLRGVFSPGPFGRPDWNGSRDEWQAWRQAVAGEYRRASAAWQALAAAVDASNVPDWARRAVARAGGAADELMAEWEAMVVEHDAPPMPRLTTTPAEPVLRSDVRTEAEQRQLDELAAAATRNDELRREGVDPWELYADEVAAVRATTPGSAEISHNEREAIRRRLRQISPALYTADLAGVEGGPVLRARPLSGAETGEVLAAMWGAWRRDERLVGACRDLWHEAPANADGEHPDGQDAQCPACGDRAYPATVEPSLAEVPNEPSVDELPNEPLVLPREPRSLARPGGAAGGEDEQQAGRHLAAERRRQDYLAGDDSYLDAGGAL